MPQNIKDLDDSDSTPQLETKSVFQTTQAEEAALLFAEQLRSSQAEVESYFDLLLVAQERLAKCQETYRSLFDFAPLPYMTLDEHNTIIEANPAAAGFFNTGVASLVNQSLLGCLDKNSHEVFNDCRKKTLDSATSQSCELFALRNRTPALVRITMAARQTSDHKTTFMIILKETGSD